VPRFELTRAMAARNLPRDPAARRSAGFARLGAAPPFLSGAGAVGSEPSSKPPELPSKESEGLWPATTIALDQGGAAIGRRESSEGARDSEIFDAWSALRRGLRRAVVRACSCARVDTPL